MSENSGFQSGKTAFLTGASAGIGHALAGLFAEAGYNLVLVARSEDKLRKLADELESRCSVATRVLPVDLAGEGAAKQIYDRLSSESIRVDVLVNNAGFGAVGPFGDSDPQTARAMLQVNIVALTDLTRLFLRDMLARKSGKILNVASTAAFQPGPFMAVYYATKAYVLSFSEALSEETRGAGVTVTALCPGPTATEFQSAAEMDGVRIIESGMLKMMDAPAVARTGFRALQRGQPIVIPGLMNRFGAFSVRFTPRPVVRRLVRYMQEKIA